MPYGKLFKSFFFALLRSSGRVIFHPVKPRQEINGYEEETDRNDKHPYLAAGNERVNTGSRRITDSSDQESEQQSSGMISFIGEIAEDHNPEYRKESIKQIIQTPEDRKREFLAFQRQHDERSDQSGCREHSAVFPAVVRKHAGNHETDSVKQTRYFDRYTVHKI